MITKYGYDIFFSVTIVCLLIGIFSFKLIGNDAAKYSIIGFAFIVFLFTLNFFRDPERTIPQGENTIVAPADGTVIVLENVVEDQYLKCDAVQISIFMTPLNVHVNRMPVAGVVQYFKHIDGKFFNASSDKASLDNEQTHIGIEGKKTKIFFKQIAGFIARRIVAPIEIGNSYEKGERFGMIKFGSRVDVFIPKKSIIKIALNQKTVAGETILAEISE